MSYTSVPAGSPDPMSLVYRTWGNGPSSSALPRWLFSYRYEISTHLRYSGVPPLLASASRAVILLFMLPWLIVGSVTLTAPEAPSTGAGA